MVALLSLCALEARFFLQVAFPFARFQPSPILDVVQIIDVSSEFQASKFFVKGGATCCPPLSSVRREVHAVRLRHETTVPPAVNLHLRSNESPDGQAIGSLMRSFRRFPGRGLDSPGSLPYEFSTIFVLTIRQYLRRVSWLPLMPSP